MSAPRKTSRRFEPEGFDVVCTIGRVDIHAGGEHSPQEAAFLLIARHGSEGTFSFPDADGATLSVTVERSAA